MENVRLEENDRLSLIFNRKSVRSYTKEPVSDELLETLVKAGMAAPTSVNRQPWDFVVITSRSKLDRLADKLPYAKMLLGAPAAIVVCGNTRKTLLGWEQQFWVQDCSAASQNILLAAEALGLGATWTSVFPDPGRMRVVADELHLPDYAIPLNVIPVGYPEGENQPKEKWRPENLHKNRW